MAGSKRRKLLATIGEKWIGGEHDAGRSQFRKRCEHLLQLSFGARVKHMNLQPEFVRHWHEVLQLRTGGGTGRVYNESEYGRGRNELVQALQLLRPEFYAQAGDAREIAPGSVQGEGPGDSGPK